MEEFHAFVYSLRLRCSRCLPLPHILPYALPLLRLGWRPTVTLVGLRVPHGCVALPAIVTVAGWITTAARCPYAFVYLLYLVTVTFTLPDLIWLPAPRILCCAYAFYLRGFYIPPLRTRIYLATPQRIFATFPPSYLPPAPDYHLLVTPRLPRCCCVYHYVYLLPVVRLRCVAWVTRCYVLHVRTRLVTFLRLRVYAVCRLFDWRYRTRWTPVHGLRYLRLTPCSTGYPAHAVTLFIPWRCRTRTLAPFRIYALDYTRCRLDLRIVVPDFAFPLRLPFVPPTFCPGCLFGSCHALRVRSLGLPLHLPVVTLIVRLLLPLITLLCPGVTVTLTFADVTALLLPV